MQCPKTPYKPASAVVRQAQISEGTIAKNLTVIRKMWDRMKPGVVIALLSIGLIATAFCLQERIGINLGDEGFLWYGVQRVLRGEVPGRDFHAYEPGRYLWDAAVAMVLRSDGLLQLRIANAAFATIGLFLALLAVRTVLRSWSLLLLFGAILTLWLFPRHKLFEHSIAMAGVFIATQLIRLPTRRHHALAGAFIGVAAFFGRNHGLYMGISLSLTAIYVYLRVDRQDALRRAAAFTGGIFVGLLPLTSMILFVPGFWRSIVESIASMSQGTPNQQPLPIPWPWVLAVSTLPVPQAAFEIAMSISFVLIPALLVSVLLWAIMLQRSAIQGRALIIASALVGITYAHHAYSRPDFYHLAQAMHPLLLCAIGLIALAIQNRKQWSAALMTIALIAFSAATAMYAMPLAEYRRLPVTERATLEIDGHKFYVTTAQKQVLTNLQKEVAMYVGPGENFAAAPLYPFAYAFMHARSPWWDTYHLFARDPAWQQSMIQALSTRRVSLIMLSTTVAVDNRQELQFPNSNPLVWQYIQLHFAPKGPPSGDVWFWHVRRDTPFRRPAND